MEKIRLFTPRFPRELPSILIASPPGNPLWENGADGHDVASVGYVRDNDDGHCHAIMMVLEFMTSSAVTVIVNVIVIYDVIHRPANNIIIDNSALNQKRTA